MKSLHRPQLKRSVRTCAKKQVNGWVPTPHSLKNEINKSVTEIIVYTTKPVTDIILRIEQKLENIDQKIEKLIENEKD